MLLSRATRHPDRESPSHAEGAGPRPGGSRRARTARLLGIGADAAGAPRLHRHRHLRQVAGARRPAHARGRLRALRRATSLLVVAFALRRRRALPAHRQPRRGLRARRLPARQHRPQLRGARLPAADHDRGDHVLRRRSGSACCRSRSSARRSGRAAGRRSSSASSASSSSPGPGRATSTGRSLLSLGAALCGALYSILTRRLAGRDSTDHPAVLRRPRRHPRHGAARARRLDLADRRGELARLLRHRRLRLGVAPGLIIAHRFAPASTLAPFSLRADRSR